MKSRRRENAVSGSGRVKIARRVAQGYRPTRRALRLDRYLRASGADV